MSDKYDLVFAIDRALNNSEYRFYRRKGSPEPPRGWYDIIKEGSNGREFNDFHHLKARFYRRVEYTSELQTWLFSRDREIPPVGNFYARRSTKTDDREVWISPDRVTICTWRSTPQFVNLMDVIVFDFRAHWGYVAKSSPTGSYGPYGSELRQHLSQFLRFEGEHPDVQKFFANPNPRKRQRHVVPFPLKAVSHPEDLQVALPSYPEMETSHLVAKASKRFHSVNANFIESLWGLKGLRGTIRQLLSLPKSRKSLKEISGSYLGYTYGVRPLADDVRDAIAAFASLPRLEKLTGTRNWNVTDQDCDISGTDRVHLYVQGPSTSLFDRLERKGLAPTMENAWNLVPWSFAIDWFVDIGSFLGRLDTATRLARMPIEYSSGSRTVAGNIPHPLGQIEFSDYRRWRYPSVPSPVYPGIDTPFSPSWLEGSALIAQRKGSNK